MNDTSRQIQRVQHRILMLVENDKLSRPLRDYLSNMGYDVKVVSTRASLQTTWEIWLPSLILVDMGLSDTGACVECDQLLAKHTGPRIPVILLCGKEDGTCNLPINIRRLEDYINKPVSTEELIWRIQRARDHASQAGIVGHNS